MTAKGPTAASNTGYRIGHAPARTTDDHAFGSTLFAGRWHTLRPGPHPRRVIYAAGSRALAQLEKRVHANGIAPVNQALFALTLPPDMAVQHAQALGLSPGWRADSGISQLFGENWLDGTQSLALWVPSYVEPAEPNLLINPNHPRISEVTLVVERDPFEFDPRLI